ncbi:hypothetical protein LZ30DRAFT_434545 [Colletotrichum cereale]|nr:hypothetical protein LZ30DRAFT_434545 [Colletotrichum cereale]
MTQQKIRHTLRTQPSRALAGSGTHRGPVLIHQRRPSLSGNDAGCIVNSLKFRHCRFGHARLSTADLVRISGAARQDVGGSTTFNSTPATWDGSRHTQGRSMPHKRQDAEEEKEEEEYLGSRRRLERKEFATPSQALSLATFHPRFDRLPSDQTAPMGCSANELRTERSPGDLGLGFYTTNAARCWCWCGFAANSS